MLVGGHDRVDLPDRHRQGHDPFEFAVHAHRRHHPRGGGVQLRLILLKVGDPHEVDIVGRHGFLVGAAQVGSAIGTGENVGPQIRTLHDAVDDVALHIKQERIPVIETGDDAAQEKVEAGVGGRPRAAVAGVLGGGRVGRRPGRRGVVRLKVFLRVGTRQHRLEIDRVTGDPFDRFDHVVFVVIDQGLFFGRRDVRVGQLGKGGAEVRRRFVDAETATLHDQRTRQLPEQRLHCPLLGLAHLDQPFGFDFPQCGAAGHGSDETDHRDAQNAREQHCDQDFGLDAEPETAARLARTRDGLVSRAGFDAGCGIG